MARLSRLAIGGFAHHVIQRALPDLRPFATGADHSFLLECLAQACRVHGVALHAYVIMEDHLHLLVTPAEAASLSRMMQAVGRAYGRYFNDRYGRRGTLWEGRYRCTVVQGSEFMLPCMVLIDTNPVVCGVVARAGEYPWSSHAHYAGLRVDPMLMPPAEYWSLGNTPFAREAAYAQMVERGLDAAVRHQIAESALRGWALGTSEFVAQIQKKTDRRVTKKQPGRPANEAVSS